METFRVQENNRVLVTWKSGKPVSERETSNATVEIPYHRVVTNLCCTSDEINDGARGWFWVAVLKQEFLV
jgi:hypothetical protein